VSCEQTNLADIELTLAIGVHGPGRLDIFVA